MKLSKKWQLRLQQLIFYGLLVTVIIIAARLSLVTNTAFDWTANQRHSLSEQTISLLESIDKPIQIMVFVSPNNDFAAAVTQILDRYQRYSDQLQLEIIDPTRAPKRVKQFNIQQQGEMLVQRGEQTERVQDLSEQSLSNALLRVSRGVTPNVVFLTGHGERSPDSEANFGVSLWAQALRDQGFEITTINLASSGQIPDSTDLLVIASPEHSWLPGEVTQLQNYIKAGGNLLWLSEPDSHEYLAELASSLDVQWLPGTVIDPNASLLGIDDPSFALLSDFANHPLTKDLPSVVLMPAAAALQTTNVESANWQSTELLRTQPETWAELSELQSADITFNDEQDIGGPLTVALSLQRDRPENEASQRIVIIGDGDFLSNQYLGNGANQTLATSMVNWLTAQDDRLNIAIKPTPDNQLVLSFSETLIIAIGFLFVLPVILLGSGLTLWWLRRRR
ncbi:MAG TPA: DUF4350 domain-containing protein [Methylophaga sp.]|nr:DUF4350 domain-containing protein [Methylophaga sp.]